MDKETRLQAEEKIMDVVCALCHWPYVYTDEELMYSERCDCCLAAVAVGSVLDAIAGKEDHA